MKVTRLYTGPNDESRFEEIEAEIGKLVPGEGIVFRQAPPGDVQDWHPAPRRQYVITLAGQGEIETDDLTGRGHITRVVSREPRLYVMIPLK